MWFSQIEADFSSRLVADLNPFSLKLVGLNGDRGAEF